MAAWCSKKTVHARRHWRPAVRHEQKAHLVAVAAVARVGRVVELMLSKPPGGAMHLTGRVMAAATGVSLRSACDFQPRPAKPGQPPRAVEAMGYLTSLHWATPAATNNCG